MSSCKWQSPTNYVLNTVQSLSFPEAARGRADDIVMRSADARAAVICPALLLYMALWNVIPCGLVWGINITSSPHFFFQSQSVHTLRGTACTEHSY